MAREGLRLPSRGDARGGEADLRADAGRPVRRRQLGCGPNAAARSGAGAGLRPSAGQEGGDDARV
eukprot:7331960-Prymnesium_polylepis.1